MAISLFDSDDKERKTQKPISGVYNGTVTDDCDLIMQGKVLVRIPSLDQEVWARISSPGAGNGAGFFYQPRPNDEVLIALNNNEPADAFIVGGLWGTLDSPPVSDPVQSKTKRVLRTGLVAGIGHEVEFDDGPDQSIKITTTTKQKIVIDPFKIELSNTAGTLTITLDNKQQKITIDGPQIEIGSMKTAMIKLNAKSISIGDMTSTVTTTVQGGMVLIN